MKRKTFIQYMILANVKRDQKFWYRLGLISPIYVEGGVYKMKVGLLSWTAYERLLDTMGQMVTHTAV